MLKSFILIVVLALTLISCGTRNRMVYMQDSVPTEERASSYTPTFKPDDYISITVTANDHESAIPFNFPKDLVPPQTFPMQQMYLGMPVKKGYLVDDDGNIDLPILGTINVKGLTRKELIKDLKLKYKKYLENPIVNVKIENFKVTVLGEVQKPGAYIVPNERLTLLEAIGLAGDLKITGERNNVMVIREKDDQRHEYRVDLTSKSFFDSPVYYLEQNDVVYVEPNIAARTQGTFWRTTGSILISVASLTITTIILVTN